MSAPTILRVKRRLEDNPQDALVITCKRIKTDTKELSPSLFVFRGTVESQETTHIKELVPHSDIKVQTAPNIKDIVEKLRKERKEVSLKSHYEIVNCSRGLKDIDKEDQFNLVDLQRSDDTDDGIQYAYDVYTAAKQDFDISTVDNYVSIETDLVFDSYNSAGLHQSDDEADDDDDSNDENNWRNEYPDSEPSSIDEEDMIRAMERLDIGEELSSDEGEDRIYENPNEMFQSNAEQYGTAYAKYKARVLKENPDLADGKGLILWADKDVESYKDDSDDGFYYGQDEDTEQFKEQYKSSSDEYSPD